MIRPNGQFDWRYAFARLLCYPFIAATLAFIISGAFAPEVTFGEYQDGKRVMNSTRVWAPGSNPNDTREDS